MRASFPAGDAGFGWRGGGANARGRLPMRRAFRPTISFASPYRGRGGGSSWEIPPALLGACARRTLSRLR
jgi:hypothetical protein